MLELSAVVVFAALFIFLLAFAGGDSGVRSRLDELWAAQERRPQDDQREDLTLKQRMLAPMAESIVAQVRRVMPRSMLEGVQHKLILAGEPMTLNGFLLFQVITTGMLLLVPVLVIIAGGLGFNPVMWLVVGLFGVVGFLLPHLWLRQRVGQRRLQIIKQLSDSFDLITTCVEAGLGLDAALARVAEKVEGPFAQELRRTLRDISLGKMRREAMRELSERTDVQDLTTFVNAVIQAEQMGSSIGAVLRVQSEQLRVRRRQRAEEAAYKAPIKMLFPLVLCIFPTLFIVILGPAVITIMTQFPS